MKSIIGLVIVIMPIVSFATINESYIYFVSPENNNLNDAKCLHIALEEKGEMIIYKDGHYYALTPENHTSWCKCDNKNREQEEIDFLFPRY